MDKKGGSTMLACISASSMLVSVMVPVVFAIAGVFIYTRIMRSVG